MPEKGGRPASSWAMSVVLGCSMPVAKPQAVPPVMMATAVIESSPSARQIITSTGAKATNSTSPRVSMMRQNRTNMPRTNRVLRPRYFRASSPMEECMAPDWITTAKAAPEHRSMKSRSAALLAPFAMCSGMRRKFTGAFWTQWNEPPSTTDLPDSSLTRLNSPAGMTHVMRQARHTTAKMITSVFIAFLGFTAIAAFFSSDTTKTSLTMENGICGPTPRHRGPPCWTGTPPESRPAGRE